MASYRPACAHVCKPSLQAPSACAIIAFFYGDSEVITCVHGERLHVYAVISTPVHLGGYSRDAEAGVSV